MKKLDLTQDEAIIHMQVLRREVDILKSRFQPQDTGHIRTAVDVLEDRLNEIMIRVFAEDKKQ
jgi:hypothetical protein